MEKRKRTRVDFSIKVEVARPGGEFKCMDLRDLSMRGLYAYTRKPFNIGEDCDIRIGLLDGNDEAVIVSKGVVVRTDGKGMGIQITEIDADGFQHLRNIMYYNTGDPEKIDKELALPSFKP
ncbi:MAG: PilZ domain-containing protein [Deltaproteobacteria bacterium]|nr:PilZ domain-containing protein [Deltaproteobacteria bacterium]